MNSDANPLYVTDTHSMYWYLKYPERLSVAAEAVFRLAETGNANIVLPAVVVAELYFLSVKLGQTFTPAELFNEMAEQDGMHFSELGRQQLIELATLDDIPEMHDRLIAAEAFLRNAPIITRDAVLTNSRHVVTIW